MCFKSYIMYAADFKREMRHANYARFFVNLKRGARGASNEMLTHYLLTRTC